MLSVLLFRKTDFFIGDRLMETLNSIIALSDDELFTRAGQVSQNLSKVYWYPVALHGGCTTNPPCRHCKWESFKYERPWFTDRKILDDVLRLAEAGLRAGATTFRMDGI
jgi:biotin synthase